MSNKDADFGLPDKAMVTLLASTVKSVKVLCGNSGRVDTDDGEIRYVSVKDLRRLLKDKIAFQDSISGFIVPVPQISGPIWNARLAKMCKMLEENNDILYELFDDDIEISPVRSWYYTNLEKYILRTYMLPLKRFAKSIGKEIVFGLGNIEMQYDLMKNAINPAVLQGAGLSLAVHKGSGNIEKELGFSGDDFVITGDSLQKVEKCENAKILLIKPIRGVMERFVQGEIKNKPNRLETPALLSAIESVYYSDMLIENGYSFDVTDEIRFSKVSDLEKYEHILICKSCLFTERQRTKIDKLQKCGVKINDRDLICNLSQKGEE